MIFEQVATGGCQSYLIGCPNSYVAAVIDPEIRQVERYQAIAAQHGLRIRYVIDTHTHADHFSGSKRLGAALGVPVVMHKLSPAPYADMRVDEGETIKVGETRLRVLHTPGHTRDSMCLVSNDRVFTGDTLLIGATGRTDLPSGDPGELYDSLFNKLLKLDPKLKIYPAHDYKGHTCSTIGDELTDNPRLQKRDREAFIEMMRTLSLSMPEHLTEALRVNMSGGVSVAQLLFEAATQTPFMTLEDARDAIESGANDFIVLDTREKEAFEAGHIPGAIHLPRGQLELRVNDVLLDPTVRILCTCEFGKISTLAAQTLRRMGFSRTVALDGGLQAWRDQGFPTQIGAA